MNAVEYFQSSFAVISRQEIKKLLNLDANGFCTDFYLQPIMYKVNYTTSCRWNFQAEKVKILFFCKACMLI